MCAGTLRKRLGTQAKQSSPAQTMALVPHAMVFCAWMGRPVDRLHSR
jgi:hypothetical protein